MFRINHELIVIFINQHIVHSLTRKIRFFLLTLWRFGKSDMKVDQKRHLIWMDR